MYEDLAEKTQSCDNCWWSSGRAVTSRDELIHCCLHKLDQGPYMWCEKWRERFTREKP